MTAQTEMFPGLAEEARQARRLVRRLLGAEHPLVDEAELLTTEVFANAIQHSASGRPGGKVAVSVATEGSAVRIEITDEGGAAGAPHVRADLYAEGGRGLYLLDALAGGWGFRTDRAGTTVWFRLTCASADPTA
ncbi:MAG TPA: ATP-binding protein [Streptosporangiaceae bacterium]